MNQLLHERLRAEGRDKFVKSRIEHSELVLSRFKRKSWEFRKLVAGDFGSIIGNVKSVREDGKDQPRAIGLQDLHNFIVNCFEDDGHSNRLLMKVKELLMQIAFSSPDAEFSDLRSEEANLNAGWLKSRLADPPIGCGATEEMRLAFLDFLIGGMGWSAQCINNEMPALRCADSLDINTDVTAITPARMKWTACTYREPLHYWLGLFGTKGFENELRRAISDPGDLEQIIAVDYSYDVDTAGNGSFYAWKRGVSGKLEDTPIYMSDNPHFFDVRGKRVPFIPYEPMSFMQLPSVSSPIGVVEMMLPDQIAIWKIEELQNKYLDRSAPFYQAPEGTLTEESKAAFMAGDPGALYEYKDGAGVTRVDGIQIDANLMNARSYHERQFTGHAGTNPYASGSPVEGIQFSREVSEISGNSSLVTSFIARDHSSWWSRSLRKMLAVGAQSDDMPVTIQIGDIALNFDAYRPIKSFLRPLADIVISEESTRFAPRAQRVAEAIQDIKIASTLDPRAFPNALPKAFEGYLRARDEKNIAEWLQPAQVDPVAAAASNTGQQ